MAIKNNGQNTPITKHNKKSAHPGSKNAPVKQQKDTKQYKI